MARATGAQLETQLRDARSRMVAGTVDGRSYEVMRLEDLHRSLDRLGGSADPELYRHFPIAAVAVLETHFKTSVATIIDAGSPYLERGLSFAKEHLRSHAEVLEILHRKTVTVRELVAYSLPFNSVASVESALGKLFDGDLKAMFAQAIDPYYVRNESADSEPIVANVAALWKDLNETFQRRHILAHESATDYAVSFEEAKTAVRCIHQFASALDAIMWATVWKELPFTQYEMNDAAGQRHRLTRQDLAKSLRLGLAIATENGERTRFRKVHFAWRQYAQQWIQWEDEAFTMGSIRPFVAALARDRALTARREAVDAWIELMRPDLDVSQR